MSTDIETAFHSSLDRLLRGEATLDACVADYPEHQERLRDLLVVALDLQALTPLPLDRPAVERGARLIDEELQHLRARLDRQPEPASAWERLTWWFPRFMPVRMAGLAAAFAMALVAYGGVTLAAVNSGPDSALYGYRLTLEELRIGFASNEEKAYLYLDTAEQRLREIESAAGAGDTVAVARASTAYEDVVRKGVDVLGAVARDTEPGAERTGDVAANYRRRLAEHDTRFNSLTHSAAEAQRATLSRAQSLAQAGLQDVHSGPILAAAPTAAPDPGLTPTVTVPATLAIPSSTPTAAPTAPVTPAPTPAPATPTPTPTPEVTPAPTPTATPVPAIDVTGSAVVVTGDLNAVTDAALVVAGITITRGDVAAVEAVPLASRVRAEAQVEGDGSLKLVGLAIAHAEAEADSQPTATPDPTPSPGPTATEGTATPEATATATPADVESTTTPDASPTAEPTASESPPAPDASPTPTAAEGETTTPPEATVTESPTPDASPTPTATEGEPTATPATTPSTEPTPTQPPADVSPSAPVVEGTPSPTPEATPSPEATAADGAPTPSGESQPTPEPDAIATPADGAPPPPTADQTPTEIPASPTPTEGEPTTASETPAPEPTPAESQPTAAPPSTPTPAPIEPAPPTLQGILVAIDSFSVRAGGIVFSRPLDTPLVLRGHTAPGDMVLVTFEALRAASSYVLVAKEVAPAPPPDGPVATRWQGFVRELGEDALTLNGVRVQVPPAAREEDVWAELEDGALVEIELSDAAEPSAAAIRRVGSAAQSFSNLALAPFG